MDIGRRMGTRDVVKAVTACLAYMAVGPILIILNNHLMREVGFSYPITLSCFGMVFSTAIAWALVHVLRVVRLEQQERIDRSFFFKKLMPVGLFSAMTLWSGNVVYMHLTVSFIQILKAFTPVVTMVLLYLAAVETPSQQSVVAVTGISIGTCIAVYGEINFSMIGMVYMLISQLTEGFRLVITQMLLRNMKFSPIESLYYLAPAGVAWMLVAIVFLEWQAMVEHNAIAIVKDNLGLFMLAGTLGFCVNVLGYLVIKTTSSVTLKVLSVARTAGLVLFAAIFMAEPISLLEAVGYAFAMLCFGYFNYVKMYGPAPVPEPQVLPTVVDEKKSVH